MILWKQDLVVYTYMNALFVKAYLICYELAYK
jgi:hypothetical protein